MTRQSRLRCGPPVVAALWVADAVSWLAWWLLKLFTEWGAVQCGCRLNAEWTADLPRPRARRRDVALRREIELGFSQLEEFLSAGCRADGSTPQPEEKSHRTRHDPGHG